MCYALSPPPSPIVIVSFPPLSQSLVTETALVTKKPKALNQKLCITIQSLGGVDGENTCSLYCLLSLHTPLLNSLEWCIYITKGHFPKTS